jgi:hypothetical protein
MEMRCGRYELEAMWAHQRGFLKAFTTAVLAAHPDVEQFSKGIKITTLTPPAQTPNTSAKSATTAVTSPVPAPQAYCICGLCFLVSDSKAECQEHLKTASTSKGKVNPRRQPYSATLGLRHTSLILPNHAALPSHVGTVSPCLQICTRSGLYHHIKVS